MPKSTDIELDLRPTASAFVSPISNGPPPVLYSSIAIKKTDDDGCISCAVVGIRRGPLNEFIRQLAASDSTPVSSGVSISENIPDIPQLPSIPQKFVLIEFYGSSSGIGAPGSQSGTLEGFRLVADGLYELWKEPGLVYPNWAGNSPYSEPFAIPAVAVEIPSYVSMVEFFVLENSNGYPVSPGPIYSPYTTQTTGTVWWYKLTFWDGDIREEINTAGFRFSPPSGDAYWTPQGKVGVEGLVFSKSITP